MATGWRRTGMDGQIYGLDYALIFEVTKHFEVEITREFIMRLRIFEAEVLSMIQNQSKNKICTAKEKANCQFQYGEYFEWACKNCEKAGVN